MAVKAPGDLATAAVRAISPYVPGKPVSELERELGLSGIVKLASNENPLGPSPRALQAMRAALDESWVYPDGSGHALKQALHSALGVAPDCLTLGNGSNDVLVLLAEAFLTPQDEAIYSQYAFAVYPIAVQATGAKAVVVPALAADHPQMPLGHDLQAMAAAIGARTRLIFIANPNNPTGTWLTSSALRRFLQAVPTTTLVVLDEAYFEYALGQDLGDGLAWLKEFPQLVIVRTFSKAYGLAGLRLGFAAAHPSVSDVLNRLRQSFNVNLLALAAGVEALRDVQHVEQARQCVTAGMRQWQQALPALKVSAVPSAGNFLLLRIGPRAAAVYEFMLHQGVIVRPVANYGLGSWLRVTIGTAAQNERAISALSAALRAVGA